MDGKLIELPPGRRKIACQHMERMPVLLNPKADITIGPEVDVQIVYLEEIPSEIGWHGTCPKCGQRYFSQAE